MTPEEELRETCPYQSDCDFPECCSGGCEAELWAIRAKRFRLTTLFVVAALCALALALLSGCASAPPPRVLTDVRTVEVRVEVPVKCPPPAEPATQEPDLAPADFDDEATRMFIEVRLKALRKEITGLRRHAEACAEGVN